MNLKEIACPRCNKKYFKERNGFSNVFATVFDARINDCVYRPQPDRIYKDGELQNPEAFIPDPTRTYYECLDCGCKFYVRTTYHYQAPETIEIIDQDREAEELKAKLKEQREKLAQEYKAAQSSSITSEATPVSFENSAVLNTSVASSDMVISCKTKYDDALEQVCKVLRLVVKNSDLSNKDKEELNNFLDRAQELIKNND